MESETGARINIRGKGTARSWEKKGRDGHEDEPLHAYVTSINSEAVKKAADKIRNFIKEIVDIRVANAVAHHEDMSGNQKRLVGMSSCI